MSRATDDAMDLLHLLTAEQLTDILRNGIPVLDKESGEVVDRIPAPAAYFSAAIKFLKDNDVTADSEAERMRKLAGTVNHDLPTFNEDGEEDAYARH